MIDNTTLTLLLLLRFADIIALGRLMMVLWPAVDRTHMGRQRAHDLISAPMFYYAALRIIELIGGRLVDWVPPEDLGDVIWRGTGFLVEAGVAIWLANAKLRLRKGLL